MMEETKIYHSCLFCYRIFKQVNTTEEVEKTQRQFILLLNRFLPNDTVSSLTWINKLLSVSTKSNENSVRSVISPCADCSGIIKSFCEYYEEIQLLQIKLEWKLRTLTEIVKSSEKVKMRRKLFKKNLEESSNKLDPHEGDIIDIIKNVKNFRMEFVEKCTRKSSDSYPKVLLMRIDCSPENSKPTPNKRPYCENEINDGVHNRKVSRIATDSNNEVSLFSEILNEPNLKVEPSTLTESNDSGNERTGEFQLISECEIASPPVTSVLFHDDDYSDDIDTTPAAVIEDTNRHEVRECRCDLGEGSIPVQSKLQSCSLTSTYHEPELTTTKIEKDNSLDFQTTQNALNAATLDDASEANRISPTANLSLPSDQLSHSIEIEADPEEAAEFCKTLNDNNETTPLPMALVPLGYENASQHVEDLEAKNMIPAGEQEGITGHSRSVSLRQRHQCSTCSKYFSSSGKLHEHTGTCVQHAQDSDGESVDFDEDSQSNCDSDDLTDSNFRIDLEDLSDAISDREEDICQIQYEESSSKTVNDDIDDKKLKSKLQMNKMEIEMEHYVCKDCGRQFKSEESLKNHERKNQHAPRKGIVCPMPGCDQRFPDNEEFREHFSNSHEEPISVLNNLVARDVFKCPVSTCPEKFKSKKNLEAHKILIHNEKEKKGRREETATPLKILDDSESTSSSSNNKIADNLFPCNIDGCHERFKRKCNLIRHVNATHASDTKFYSCFICRKSSFTRQELIFHQNQVHMEIKLDTTDNTIDSKDFTPYKSDKVFQCPVSSCPEKFMNKENLKTHGKLHGTFKCQFCDETKTYAPDLAIHEAVSHGKPKTGIKARPYKAETQHFSCSRCDFPEYKERIYVQHFLQIHLNLRVVTRRTCSICKITLSGKSSRNQFLRHYKIHHDLCGKKPESVFRCDTNDCEAYFLKEDQLLFHKLLIHNEQRKFPCPKCNKVFGQRFDLNVHGMNMHKLDFHIPCSHPGCRLRFPDEERLKRHVSNFHSQVASIVCPQCKQIFKNKATLKSHIKNVHAPNKRRKPPVGKKSFLCSECGKNWKSQECLDLHVLGVHVGPEGWKFSCDVCNKKCLTQVKLDEHKRTHTKEKPFTCEHCGLSYAHRHNFKYHLKNKHGIIYGDSRRKKM